MKKLTVFDLAEDDDYYIIYEGDRLIVKGDPYDVLNILFEKLKAEVTKIEGYGAYEDFWEKIPDGSSTNVPSSLKEIKELLAEDPEKAKLKREIAHLEAEIEALKEKL